MIVFLLYFESNSIIYIHVGHLFSPISTSTQMFRKKHTWSFLRKSKPDQRPLGDLAKWKIQSAKISVGILQHRHITKTPPADLAWVHKKRFATEILKTFMQLGKANPSNRNALNCCIPNKDYFNTLDIKRAKKRIMLNVFYNQKVIWGEINFIDNSFFLDSLFIVPQLL